MAISTGGGGNAPMSDINTTPLVDVMLVLLIIFLIAVPVAIQTIEKLEIPVFESTESKDKVENLLLTVSTSDDNGVSAGEPGFQGASRNGECRVYFNNTTAVTSEELYDRAFERLDNILLAVRRRELLRGACTRPARRRGLRPDLRAAGPPRRPRGRVMSTG